MRHITAYSIKALKRATGVNPTVFQRADIVVRLRTDKGIAAEPFSVAALRGVLDRSADYVRSTKDGGESPAKPPNDVIADVLSLPNPGFPGLRGFYSVPVILPSGQLLETDGYASITESRCTRWPIPKQLS